jgi:membrane protease YdiL (CAAX protease family)
MSRAGAPGAARDPGDRWAGAYFALTFAISWLALWLAVAAGWSADSGPGLVTRAVGGIGPIVSAAVLVRTTLPPAERRSFWRRVVDVRRIRPPWLLAIAAAAAIPALGGVLFDLAAGGPGTGDGIDTALALPGVLAFALVAGAAEEPGWRGYALDRLQERHSALGASLLIGLFWMTWHLPLYFIDGTFQHDNGFGSWEFWLFSASLLPEAVLLTWVVNNTSGSILAAILLHAAVNALGEVIGFEGRAEAFRFVLTLALALAVIGAWKPATLARAPMRDLRPSVR